LSSIIRSKGSTTAQVREFIVLDKTLFYASAGGQPHDTGKLVRKSDNAEFKVIFSGIFDGEISHEVENRENTTLQEGDEVHGVLDWERRYKMMKLHSAAHLIYYPFIETLGKPKIIGSNINEDKSRIDFIYDSPINEKIPLIEKEANRIIAEGLDIITEPDEKNPEKRWWRCKDWKMPCGGTHVKNTSEIGKIKLKRKNIGKGKERVEVYLDS